MTSNVFSDEQKQKDVEAAADFHIKAAKIAQVNIVLRKFVREDLISVISFFLDRHSIFICSITGFRAINYPPPLCQRATFIYCAKYVNTYTGKSFCWHNGGGGRYAIKLFLISICFIVKKAQFLPKIKSL